MAIKRTSTAIWKGDGLTGQGILNTQSGAFKEQPYAFKSRFGDESGKAGTNPEELIAAAHAGCFSMALAFKLKEAGYTPDQLHTDATVSMDKVEGGFSFKSIELNLKAKIPGIAVDEFHQIAETAKENCPVSQALASVPIHLSAELEQSSTEVGGVVSMNP